MHHMSNEENTGQFGYIGDEILPSYIGIIVNHEIRIPIKQLIMESKRVFFVAHIFYLGNNPYQVGPLPVISRVITPFIGVISPVTHV